MRAHDIFADVFESPVGYLGCKCIYCAKMFWHGTDEHDGLEGHVETHVQLGDMELVGIDEHGPLYRPVMGRAPRHGTPEVTEHDVVRKVLDAVRRGGVGEDTR